MVWRASYVSMSSICVYRGHTIMQPPPSVEP